MPQIIPGGTGYEYEKYKIAVSCFWLKNVFDHTQFPNTKKKVENTMRSGIVFTNFETAVRRKRRNKIVNISAN